MSFRRPLALSALLVLALGAGGCLFLDEVNHPPDAVLVIVRPSGSTTGLFKGSALTFDPSLSRDIDDADAHALTFQWSVDGQDVDQWRPPAMDLGVGGDMANTPVERPPFEPCQGMNVPAPQRCFVFYTAGPHQIEVRAVDTRHAFSKPAAVLVSITDAPPSAAVLLGPPTTPCNNDYVVGLPIPLIASVVDLDSRYETIDYHWHVDVPGAKSTAASIVAAVNDDCQGATPSAGTLDYPTSLAGVPSARNACLFPDGPGTYNVELKVNDGAFLSNPGDPKTDDRPVVQRQITVVADRPACADGFDPPLGSWLLDGAMPARFAVTHVADDLDPYPPPLGRVSNVRFTWSLWREQDPVWRELRDWSLPEYTLDPSGFGLDEQVRVRVRVSDRVPRQDKCDETKDVCSVLELDPSAICINEASKCAIVATWDVRFR